MNSKFFHKHGFLLIVVFTFSLCYSDVLDSCFCQLRGFVDDCSCKVESVDSFNNLKVYPRLNSILQRNYFKFVKANLKRPCLFWADDIECAYQGCHVDSCDTDILPPGYKEHGTNKVYSTCLACSLIQCEELLDINPIPKRSIADVTPLKNIWAKWTKPSETCEQGPLLASARSDGFSTERQKALDGWQRHDDAQPLFCDLENEESPSLIWVDLTLNPERYTGYAGRSAQRIWSTIYNENCFGVRPKKTYAQVMADKDSSTGLADGVCLEKRAFYRMVSGLHSSINIHLCASYLDKATAELGQSNWGVNLREFKRRFSAETTGGFGPQWLKNLYFTYLVELRAMAKVADVLKGERFYTGVDADDGETRKAVDELLNVIKAFPHHFDETQLFLGPQSELKEEFRLKFLNITRIIDCVGCDKCRLWGRIQIQGMGTALKILFSDTSSDSFQLTRAEIASLFNAFGRLSTSISKLAELREMLTGDERRDFVFT